MNRASTFVRSFLVVGILVSGVSRLAATPVTYSSMSTEQNLDPNDPNEFSGSDSQDMADHAYDLSKAEPVEANFLGALSSYGTETYEEIAAYPLPQVPPLYEPGALTFGATGITGSTSFTFVAPGGTGSFAVSGKYLVSYPGESGNSISFSTLVTAFGTYIDDVGAWPSGGPDALSLTLTNTNTMASETVQIGTAGLGPDDSFAPWDLDNIFYFGVTDANFPFNEVTFGLTNPGDGPLLDNTSVGFAEAVPEPSSLALVCGGLLTGLAFFVRRRTTTLPACGSC